MRATYAPMYKGLVIGGPLDGQLMERPSPLFEMLAPDPFKALPPVSLTPHLTSGPIDVIRYRYVQGPGDIHFWLPEGATLADALTILVVTYMSKGELT